MEQKIYQLLGVNLYRKFVIKVKKGYDKWRGKAGEKILKSAAKIK